MRNRLSVRGPAGPIWVCLGILGIVGASTRSVTAQNQSDWESAWDAEDERYDGIGDEDDEEQQPRRRSDGEKRESADDGFYDDQAAEESEAAGDAGYEDGDDGDDDDPFASSHRDARHGGFFLQFGAGIGYYTASGTEPVGEVTLSGMTIPLELHVGGTLADTIVLGAGLNVDYAPSPSIAMGDMELELGEVTQLVLGLDAFALYYIDRELGLSVQARAGWGGIETVSSGPAGGSDPTGFVGGLGVGKDFWLGGTVGVGALLRASYGMFALGGVTYGTLSLGAIATVTWY